MKAEQIFDVKGAIAVVTGAASGLGLAMAEVMAENGARVTMIDKDAANLDAQVARLRQGGCAVTPAVVDVADLEKLRAAIDEVAERESRIDACFCNAGMSGGPGFLTPIGQMNAVEIDKWDEVLHVNLTSVFVTLRAAAAHMKKQRSGRLIVTSSIAGIIGERNVSYVYTAAKAALNNIVRLAALELAQYNVCVNAIAPGPFLTNIAGGRLHRDPEARRAFETMVPLGRIADTAELKGLALLLASPASSFITGTVIPIDGGTTAG